ncbi:LptF/LptG family permease [Haliovirga abyssi]|uniref:LPS export ABC transporter permease LptG n=1 Tax=Haliovirga abyssi TaxID=2996794 RepID=A0AAU9D468_9FUSO|nr:LptF/LptG family permease [Haliovirga abyssi]BDU50771.1 LPS export ABC transporter permease LptG [Haliovirga abyssi]
MKKLDKYILKSFIKSFLLGVMAFLIIFILSEMFRIIGYIMDGKLTPIQGFILLLNGLPTVMINVIPLGVLLGGLMTVNKMATNLEIMALKTSGVSFKRIILAPVILSGLISIGLLWFNNNVVPNSNKKYRELKNNEVYNVKESRIKTDVFMKGQGNYLTYIRLVNGNNISDSEIVLLDNSFSKIEKIITVKRGKYNIKLKKWYFSRVKINDIINNKIETMGFYEPDFFKETPSDLLRDKVREKEMNISELKDAANFIKKTGGDVKKILVAMYKKMAYPFAALIMSFIGLSLGSRYIRGASAVSIGLSVVIGYIYYVVTATTEALGVGGFLSPMLSGWIPDILFLVLGISLVKISEY